MKCNPLECNRDERVIIFRWRGYVGQSVLWRAGRQIQQCEGQEVECFSHESLAPMKSNVCTDHVVSTAFFALFHLIFWLKETRLSSITLSILSFHLSLTDGTQSHPTPIQPISSFPIPKVNKSTVHLARWFALTRKIGWICWLVDSLKLFQPFSNWIQRDQGGHFDWLSRLTFSRLDRRQPLELWRATSYRRRSVVQFRRWPTTNANGVMMCGRSFGLWLLKPVGSSFCCQIGSNWLCSFVFIL